MTYKKFIDTEEAIFEDWRLWAMGLDKKEIDKQLKLMWKQRIKDEFKR